MKNFTQNFVYSLGHKTTHMGKNNNNTTYIQMVAVQTTNILQFLCDSFTQTSKELNRQIESTSNTQGKAELIVDVLQFLRDQLI